VLFILLPIFVLVFALPLKPLEHLLWPVARVQGNNGNFFYACGQFDHTKVAGNYSLVIPIKATTSTLYICICVYVFYVYC